MFCGIAPNSPLANAAAFFTITMPRTNSGTSEMVTLEILKFSTALKVWIPQYASAGTSRSPNKSTSFLY